MEFVSNLNACWFVCYFFQTHKNSEFIFREKMWWVTEKKMCYMYVHTIYLHPHPFQFCHVTRFEKNVASLVLIYFQVIYIFLWPRMIKHNLQPSYYYLPRYVFMRPWMTAQEGHNPKIKVDESEGHHSKLNCTMSFLFILNYHNGIVIVYLSRRIRISFHLAINSCVIFQTTNSDFRFPNFVFPIFFFTNLYKSSFDCCC